MYIFLAAVLAICFYILQLKVYKRKWSSGLRVDAMFKQREVTAGDRAELVETLENKKWLPLTTLKMKLQLSRKLIFIDMDNANVTDFFNRTDIFFIGPYQKVTRIMKFTCPSRGYYDFHGMDVIGTDLFFTSEFVKSVDSSSSLYVYPRPFDSSRMKPILNRINGEVLTKRNIVEDPFELRGIREYQTYDVVKNINWKASAKTDELMVNMHDYTSRRTLRLFLNLEHSSMMKREELLELCISMAVAIAKQYLERGMQVSLYANTRDIISGEIIRIEENGGEQCMTTINRALARADLDADRYSFEEVFGDVLLGGDVDSYSIIVSPCLQKTFQEMLLQMVRQKQEFCWICPHYKDNVVNIMDELTGHSIEIKAEEALYEISLADSNT